MIGFVLVVVAFIVWRVIERLKQSRIDKKEVEEFIERSKNGGNNL